MNRKNSAAKSTLKPDALHQEKFSVLFGKYIRFRARYIVLLLVFAAVYLGVFALSQVPLVAVGYALLICLFLLLAVACADFYFFRKKHAALVALQKEITLTLDCLLPPHGLFEEDYQALVRTLFDESARTISRQAKKQDEAKEYFTLWAHQIKTPIAAMRLLLQGGAEDAAALSAELFKVEQYVDMAMCYLRLDAGASDYVIRPCDLDGIVRQAVRKFAPLFIRKKLRLVYDPVHATALTDEKWLLFVVEQVLSNAIKYTPSGTVTISVEEGPVLTIRDTGMGIAPADLPRVFERGYTGLNGRTDSRSTGIGLYLCRLIVTRLGHTISATSKLGEGTEVRIDLSRRDFRPE